MWQHLYEAGTPISTRVMIELTQIVALYDPVFELCKEAGVMMSRDKDESRLRVTNLAAGLKLSVPTFRVISMGKKTCTAACKVQDFDTIGIGPDWLVSYSAKQKS
jgi:hypothetical protein